MSRREAAALLGFASEFKVRQLEKQGSLRPIRGAMGSAWYPRSEVTALRSSVAAEDGGRSRGAAPGSPAIERWSDAALIRHLRSTASLDADGSRSAPTVVDLIADTGVSIARAEKVYRFWLAHDRHQVAAGERAARVAARKAGGGTGGGTGGGAGGGSPAYGPLTEAPRAEDRAPVAIRIPPGERRGGERLERDTLIRELRNPDPAVRALAFRRLKDKQNR